MDEQVTLEAEFLRRALGQGGEGETADVVVTPGALPPDLPVTLPELAGVRILGGVRAVERRPTSEPGSRPAELTHWRAFLDLPAPRPDVQRALVRHLGGVGWQAGQTMWRPSFVEALRSEWLGVHMEQGRMLTLLTRTVGEVVQVWLDVQDAEPQQLQHLLGKYPHFQDVRNAPLPVLAVPTGWRVQMQGGQGGSERSERALLIPPQGQAAEVVALLEHLSAQLAEQEWTTLLTDRGGQALRLVARTPQGFGLLNLVREEGAVAATLVHVTFTGSGGGRSYAVFS